MFMQNKINSNNSGKICSENFKSLQDYNIDEIIDTFYSFKTSPNGSIFKNYISLFLRSTTRFIDTDFRPLNPFEITEYKVLWGISQQIIGEINLKTYIVSDEKTFVNLAGNFANEAFPSNDEYVKASVGEFLNLANGIYLINMSNVGIELELTPQNVMSECELNDLKEAFCIPIVFSFGKIDIIISK